MSGTADGWGIAVAGTAVGASTGTAAGKSVGASAKGAAGSAAGAHAARIAAPPNAVALTKARLLTFFALIFSISPNKIKK